MAYLGTPVAWRRNIELLQGLNIQVPRALLDAVAAKSALEQAVGEFGDDHTEKLRTLKITKANAKEVLAETAAELAARRELSNAADLTQGVAEANIRQVAKAVANELSERLAEVAADSDLLAPYAVAARLYKHSDNPARVLDLGRAATAAFAGVKDADARLGNVFGPLRGWLSEVSGVELAGQQLLWFIDPADESIDVDRLDMLRTVVDEGGASRAQLLAEQNVRLHFNSTAEAASVVRNAARRQRVKETATEQVLVAPATNTGLRVPPQVERVTRGASVGPRGETIVARAPR